MSIKAQPEKKKVVEMGECLPRMFDESACELLINGYRQEGDRKVVSSITRMKFKEGVLARLTGDISREDVERLVKKIKAIPKIPPETFVESKREIHALKKDLNGKSPWLRLHPKISEGNRRLQFSIKKEVLFQVAESVEIYGENSRRKSFGTLSLPYSIDSPRRSRKEK